MKDNKNFRTVLVWWMVIIICLLFLRFAVQMDRIRKGKEEREEWSERAKRASERAKRASKRGKHIEKSGVKSRHFNLYLKVIKIYNPSWM